MKISHLAYLASDVSVSGTALVPFPQIAARSDSLDVEDSGFTLRALRTSPLTFNLAMRARADVLIDLVLEKNGVDFRYLATGATQVNATVCDPSATKGDVYKIKASLIGDINSEPLYTSLAVVG